MVGGIVIETRTINSTKVWVNVEERPRTGSHKPDVCAIYVNPVVEQPRMRVNIQRGDSLWWQGEWAMWTPEPDRTFIDLRLKRIGFSGVSTPEHRA